MIDLVKRIAEQARYQYMPAETRAVLDEAAEEIKRLSEALEPFASQDMADLAARQASKNVVSFGPNTRVNYPTTLGALEIARAALRSPPPSGDGP